MTTRRSFLSSLAATALVGLGIRLTSKVGLMMAESEVLPTIGADVGSYAVTRLELWSVSHDGRVGELVATAPATTVDGLRDMFWTDVRTGEPYRGEPQFGGEA